MKKNRKYTLLFIVWCCLMFGLSSYPKLHVPFVDPKLSPDKIAHFIEYFIFSIIYVLMRKEKGVERSRLVKELLIIALVIPIFDELHQIPIPGRMFSWWDWLADTLGLCSGLCLGLSVIKKVKNENK
jgi:VanZ family protein